MEPEPANLAGDQKRRFESRPVTSGVLPLGRRSQTHAGLGADGTTSEKGYFQTHASQQSKPYSITSPALASTDAGRSRPSDLAVFRLTTSSYLVGVCTGRSAGFAPALISAILGHAGAAQRQRPPRSKLGRSCRAVLAGASASVKADAKCTRCLALHFWI